MKKQKRKSKAPFFPLQVLKPIENFLLKEEKKLKERKVTLAKEDPFADPSRLNDNAAVDTDAAEETGHERIFALKKEIDKGLIGIRKALTRIKLGRYGLCVKCGRMIDTDRLAANPTAEHCMECHKKAQRKLSAKG
jgi:RNA polymerase-binding transcription factor DksA